MAASPPAVDAAAAVRVRLANLSQNPQAPGTLTKWSEGPDHHFWEFTGNGETTSTQLVQTTLQREAEGGNAAVEPVAHSRDFAAAAASSLLNTSRPDDPIPRGEVKELSLKDLVGLIGPFLNKYAAQEKRAQGAGGGPGTTERKLDDDVDARARIATGQVVSQGLTLPLD